MKEISFGLSKRGEQASVEEVNFRKIVLPHINPRQDAFRVLNGALAIAFRTQDPLQFCYAIAALASDERLVERLAEEFHADKQMKGLL